MNLDNYTAWRIGCHPDLLRTPGTHVVASVPDRHKWLIDPYAATNREAICLLQRHGVSFVRTHLNPGPTVQTLIDKLPRDRAVTPDEVAELFTGPIHRDGIDPYFYLDDTTFTPVATDGVRQLGPHDAGHLAALHESIDPRMTWYVEIDHPIVFGLFVDHTLVSAASHFLFEEFSIAAAGVLTHAEHRQKGYGTSVVSAALAWAIERKFVSEWITNEANLGSLGIARRLGFQVHETETEFRVKSD